MENKGADLIRQLKKISHIDFKQAGLSVEKTVRTRLVVTKAEYYSCKLLLQTTEEDKEGIQEVTA